MNDNQAQIMRSNYPLLCPKCSEPVSVGIEHQVPRIISVVSKTECDKAKASLKEQVRNIYLKGEVSEEEHSGFTTWIDKEDTIISPADVELILANIAKKYETETPTVVAAPEELPLAQG